MATTAKANESSIQRVRVNIPETLALAELDACVAPASITVASAIDAFEDQQRWLCRRAFEFESDAFELGLLVMALTSASETYFRSVIAASVLSCPFCTDHNVDKGRLSLRAISYYPDGLIPFALLEHVSFSDSEAIRKQTSELLQIQLPTSDRGSSSISSALSEFDKVCALRHSLIHSLGLLNSQNCAEAGLAGDGIKVVSVSIEGFQVIADVCLNVVRAYNGFVFQQLVQRLYDRKFLSGALEADKVSIAKLKAVFLSRSSPDYLHEEDAMISRIISTFAPTSQASAVASSAVVGAPSGQTASPSAISS